jgi:TonB family protein
MLIAALLLTQAITAPPTPDPSAFLLIKSHSAAIQLPQLKAVAPTFPAELRAAVQVTRVVVDVVVDGHGRIARASIRRGDERAHQAALRAAIQWMFEPDPRDVSERSLALSFSFRTLPAEAKPEELVTVFTQDRGVEVRATVAVEDPRP